MTRRDFIAAASAIPALSAAPPPVPVLVELFTSEGCSSCPPADKLLGELDRQQLVSGAEVLVLSEHVDYWNHIGWRDPFSSSFFSTRQRSYAEKIRNSGVYTPQMIVDGQTQFVGSDAPAAQAAIRKAASQSKAELRLNLDGKRVGIQLTDLSEKVETEIYLITARDSASSKVTRGENGGRELMHVAIASRFLRVGVTRDGRDWKGTADLPAKFVAGWRLLGIAQQLQSGRVVAAARLATVTPS